MELSVWISYDLGIKGDFNGLYQWLDTHKGKECGNSTAFINYTYKTDFFSELKKDIEENIEIKSTDRIYIIFKNPETSKITGKFLIGNRKASPWEGYAPSKETLEDVIL